MEEFDRDAGEIAQAMTCRTAIVLAPSRRKFSCKINAAYCKEQWNRTAGEFRLQRQRRAPPRTAKNNEHQAKNKAGGTPVGWVELFRAFTPVFAGYAKPIGGRGIGTDR
jgi:hypothetical protein